MLVLAYLGHAYIFGARPYATSLPASVAVPWQQVAHALHRPPVLSYATHILHNWSRLDPAGPIDLTNLARSTRFLGGMDEDWFGMIHIALEAQAAPALRALLALSDATRAGNVAHARAELTTIAAVIEELILTLARMAEGCDPYIYYHRVRPFLSGWRDNPDLPEGVVYSGVTAYGGKPQRWRGASGAQSSVIPAIDAALGIDFAHDPFNAYLRDLERYMPPRQRAFITWLRGEPGIRAFAQDHAATEPALVEAYNACLSASRHFREAHLGFAGRYIHAQSVREHSRTGAVGTGGTPFMPYLQQHAQTLDAYRL
jgi:indoleamine 2,3-dioxygenase